MVTDVEGENVWPQARIISGQRLWEYSDHMVFILDNKIFFHAGETHWPKRFRAGDLKKPGIGLNKGLYKTALKSDKDFIIFDKNNDRFLRLTDYTVFTEGGIESRGRKTIIVTPIDAYRVIKDTSFLDPKLKRMRSN